MILDISNHEALPTEIRSELLQFEQMFQRETYVEALYDDGTFRALASRVEDWILEQDLRVYHCTRVKSIEHALNNGLRVLDRESHQREFLMDFGDQFSDDEKAFIDAQWSAYFTSQQDRCRNGRIFFCNSRYLIKDDGTAPFFEYYGGEAVFMPLKGSPVSSKLRTFGVPAVVEFTLRASDVLVASHPLDKAILSHFHQSINPEALLFGSEGHIKRDVLPIEIIRVVELKHFIQEQ